ncbi:hypothetical protein B0H14DRAFT_3741773 [Mycena olivaceomarginata]|nr:hypothetical protein B0H14DRAFT_3741773 [Mycena olivaceomarginata]
MTTAFKTSDIVLGTVDGFPPWPGEIVDPATAPDAIKAKRFAKKNTALVHAWLAPTRVTHLSVTQIEEFANSRHKKPQLVNGFRKAAERAKDNRQIAPPNLKGKRSKWGGGGEEIFPIDNNKRKHQARAGAEEHRLLPEGYRPPAISANLGVVPVVFAQSIHLGPGGPVFCSDIAMTFELSLNARIFGHTTLQSDADLLLAFFQVMVERGTSNTYATRTQC